MSVHGNSPKVHLLIDHYGGAFLGDPERLEEALLGAATEAGATVLSCKMHHFGDAGGVTGVLLLAESHISIHTWPEEELASIDIFMCGTANPQRAADHLERVLCPERVKTTRVIRGQRNQ